jgi:hypothetical protein
MKYFDTLPKIIYSNPITGNQNIMTNLMVRASIIPSLLNNPMVFYQYNVQEGDTPEIVAYKYYGDSYRYWAVLFANQYLDPQWDWPLSYNEFNAYIQDKYTNNNIDPYGTVYGYQMTQTQYDVNTQTTTTTTTSITQQEYNSFIGINETLTLPTGPVQVTTTASAISVYEYELNQNEAKRSINIINADYINEVESQFKKLMAI